MIIISYTRVRMKSARRTCSNTLKRIANLNDIGTYVYTPRRQAGVSPDVNIVLRVPSARISSRRTTILKIICESSVVCKCASSRVIIIITPSGKRVVSRNVLPTFWDPDVVNDPYKLVLTAVQVLLVRTRCDDDARISPNQRQWHTVAFEVVDVFFFFIITVIIARYACWLFSTYYLFAMRFFSNRIQCVYRSVRKFYFIYI